VKLQLERLVLRDNITEKQAMSRLNSQMNAEQKRGFANLVIDN